MSVPPLTGVLETILYFDDEPATARFYGDIMGFRSIGHDPGRFLFYRAGTSVFLLFRRDAVRGANGKLPAHGADGTIHTCFQVPVEAYEAWKRYLPEQGVPVMQEVEWPRGRSFYFEDPAGNLLEIANRDIWPD